MSTGNTREALAGNARAALARARITTSSLASQTGKSRAYWSRRLDGTHSLTTDDLVALSDLTGVPVTDLVRAA